MIKFNRSLLTLCSQLFQIISWLQQKIWKDNKHMSLWNEIKNWFHLLKVFSHISLGFPFAIPEWVGSQAWIQIIIMAWSFEVKLLKLFLMHSKRLFIWPHYCRENIDNRNWASRDTSDDLVPLLTPISGFLALHLVYCAANETI